MRHLEHGRILDVTTETLGSTLSADTAAGALALVVDDAGDFEDDGSGGWLQINGQVIQYGDVDDDTGTITLLAPLAADAEDGDEVAVWNDLYQQPDTIQRLLAKVDGEDDNTDPVTATLADGLDELPEGTRGKASESCTMEQTTADDWQVVAIDGRPHGSGSVKFWDQDTFAAVADGAQAFTLTHLPIDGSVHMAWGTLWQPHTEFTVAGKSVTVADSSGLVLAGDVFDFRYAYRDGVTHDTAAAILPPTLWWKFDETSGGVAIDASGNGHIGTNSGATINQAPVFTGQGRSYDFTAGSVNATPWNPVLGEWTFIADINPASVSGFQGIANLGTVEMFVSSGYLNIQRNIAGNFSGATLLAAGTSYRVAVTVQNDGSGLPKLATLYVNGSADGGGTAAGGAWTFAQDEPLVVGLAGGIHFAGRIDNARLWATALSAEQIASDWNGGAV